MKESKALIDDLDLENGVAYERKELMKGLAEAKPGLSFSAYAWMLRELVASGELIQQSRGLYSLPSSSRKGKCSFSYSKEATTLMDLIGKRFPAVGFSVFETVLLNEFLNHLIAQNTLFLQVEKESGEAVFEYLLGKGYKVMYKPNLKDFHRYWSKGCIIVVDRISEAPSTKEKSHSITLEGMLVDMLAEKLLASTFEKDEYASVIAQARENYLLNEPRMLRYARRRNKEKELRRYLEGGKEENAIT